MWVRKWAGHWRVGRSESLCDENGELANVLGHDAQTKRDAVVPLGRLVVVDLVGLGLDWLGCMDDKTCAEPDAEACCSYECDSEGCHWHA